MYKNTSIIMASAIVAILTTPALALALPNQAFAQPGQISNGGGGYSEGYRGQPASNSGHVGHSGLLGLVFLPTLLEHGAQLGKVLAGHEVIICPGSPSCPAR